MESFPLLVLFLASRAVCEEEVSPTQINDENRTFTPGEIIWQDEFDSLDMSKWSREINMNRGYNNELQIYADYPENAYVRDGILHIRPTLSLDTVFLGNYENFYNGLLKLERCTDMDVNTCSRQAAYPHIHLPIVSQRLRTLGKFSFRYGRVLVKARLPSGDWTWPAIWMLSDTSSYGGWPISGEIDIMESRGNRKLFNSYGVNIGSEQVGSTLHFGPQWGLNAHPIAHGTKQRPKDDGFDRAFHIYELIWTTEMIQFKVDNKVIKTIKPPEDGGFFKLGAFPSDLVNPWENGTTPRMAPFDENFHFLLNVAVGGNFFPTDSEPPRAWGDVTPYLDFFNNRTAWLPSWTHENASLAVDYIRVYAV